MNEKLTRFQKLYQSSIVSAMDVKCVIFALLFLLIRVRSQESCDYIYDCCQKVEYDCVEYCEPIVICKDTFRETTVESTFTTTEEIATEAVTQTYMRPKNYTVIAVGCRKGYRHDSKGKCRPVLKK